MKKNNTWFFVFSFIALLFSSGQLWAYKLLHLTFHVGCAKEIEAVAEKLSLELTTWWIPTLPKDFLDPGYNGAALFSMGHERAKRIWDCHKEFFEQYDAIIVSDTAPLARIFLQNDFKKPLIIWVCNRFDYFDAASRDCPFPDPEYYDLMRRAESQSNVTIIPYNDFERYYAATKGVRFSHTTIKPGVSDIKEPSKTFIPSFIDRENTFFIPSYHNNYLFMDLSLKCSKLGIPTYRALYNGPGDLQHFKGIIHLPGAWSNLAFFENIQQGLPYFIPSIHFLKRLEKKGNFYIPDPIFFFKERKHELSEWYSPDNRKAIIYFDSWEHLVEIIQKTDFNELKNKTMQHGKQNKDIMLLRWKAVFDRLRACR